MIIVNSDPEQIVQFSWKVEDGIYVFMNTWNLTKQEWDSMTQEDILTRQQQEYTVWREKMGSIGAR